MPDETLLIERITSSVPSLRGTKGKSVGVELGIGDDALVLRPTAGADWVVTTDTFVEDVHFWADRHPTDSIGYKALARATSDLAAMGALPFTFLLALALPKARTGRWLDEMLSGMGRAARELELKLAGGDTTQASTVSMSLTVFGKIAPGAAIMRTGARPGDVIYVSGPLGGAELGLKLMQRGLYKDQRLRKLLRAHLYPEVRIKLGVWLATHQMASAMMDLSDGLSSDLARLCTASRVGARIYTERIPQVEVPSRFTGKLDSVAMALHGGDDYELLFTVPKQLVRKLTRAPGFSKLRAIGEVRRGAGISLVSSDERARPLKPLGWDSFREK
jgi:thiamine-monophosphate kinase